MPEVVLQARELARHYPVRSRPWSAPRPLRALDGVSFSLRAGKTLAVVGESGCGKSTLARLLTLIEPPSAGELQIADHRVGPGAALDKLPPALRRAVQIVFQDPYGSLNPRHTIGQILSESLRGERGLDAAARRRRAADMLERVGLGAAALRRYPHMFSGGQRQRIAIARALMPAPRILIADEPVSALDLSVQAQVLNLLMDLQEQLGLAYVFISHGLSVVEHIADEVMVMYLGRAVERAARAALFNAPQHPYTRALLAATPFVDPARRAARVPLRGELPSPLAPPSGCPFHRRCPQASPRCESERPALSERAPGHRVACHWRPTDSGR